MFDREVGTCGTRQRRRPIGLKTDADLGNHHCKTQLPMIGHAVNYVGVPVNTPDAAISSMIWKSAFMG